VRDRKNLEAFAQTCGGTTRESCWRDRGNRGIWKYRMPIVREVQGSPRSARPALPSGARLYLGRGMFESQAPHPNVRVGLGPRVTPSRRELAVWSEDIVIAH
jgi:hypothetical protein